MVFRFRGVKGFMGLGSRVSGLGGVKGSGVMVSGLGVVGFNSFVGLLSAGRQF